MHEESCLPSPGLLSSNQWWPKIVVRETPLRFRGIVSPLSDYSSVPKAVAVAAFCLPEKHEVLHCCCKHRVMMGPHSHSISSLSNKRAPKCNGGGPSDKFFLATSLSALLSTSSRRAVYLKFKVTLIPKVAKRVVFFNIMLIVVLLIDSGDVPSLNFEDE